MESKPEKKALFDFDNSETELPIKYLDIPKIMLPIKPLSINEAWQGRRFKTKEYIKYQRDLLMILPQIKVIPKKISLYFEFGFSNISADIDNPVKLILDIMQKKYKFNDADVWELRIKKAKVKKGFEYIHIQFL